MKTVLVIGLILAVQATAMAQPPDSLWSHTYGGFSFDQAYCVRQTTDGGFVLAGWTHSFGAGIYDMWLIKTDADGDTLWTRTFGGANDDRATSVIEVADGYVLAGRTLSFPSGNENLWLLKTDMNGDSVWSRVYGDSLAERAYAVQQTTDGGYVVAGNRGTGTASDFWLIKTDANGDSLWSRRYGGSGEDFCNSVEQTEDGGYILAGYSDSFSIGTKNMWLVRTDANGDSLWARQYGGSADESCRRARVTSDGGYILTGYTLSFGSTGYPDMWLIKTDAAGDSLWSHRYGGIWDEEAYDVVPTFDGGYFLAGWTTSFGADMVGDMCVVKTDENGDSLWSGQYGGPGGDVGYSVAPSADSGYVVAGYTESYGAGVTDAWLVKIGNSESPTEIEPSSVPRAYSLAVYPNPFNAVTRMEYELPVGGRVRLKLYDVLGHDVKTLSDEARTAGTFSVLIDGEGLASGVYLCRMKAGNYSATRKIMLVK